MSLNIVYAMGHRAVVSDQKPGVSGVMVPLTPVQSSVISACRLNAGGGNTRFSRFLAEPITGEITAQPRGEVIFPVQSPQVNRNFV